MRRRVTRSTVWAWIRSAPVTYGWLLILLATTIVQHTVSPEHLHTILDRRSTNLDNLVHSPIRAFVGSLFWLDGAYWLPYLLGFTLFLAPAERWLGSLRFVVVGMTGHVLATLISQGLLGAAIDHGRAAPHLVSAIDVGVSYAMAAVVGVLAYAVPMRWRVPYLGIAVIVVVVPLVVESPTFTAVGHAAALAVGIAMYPITRSARSADPRR